MGDVLEFKKKEVPKPKPYYVIFRNGQHIRVSKEVFEKERDNATRNRPRKLLSHYKEPQ